MGEKKFKLSMLEYSKVILSKISFDKKLFRKEYKKAFRYLDKDDRVALKHWVRAQWSSVLNTSDRSEGVIRWTSVG
jgi:hypothetical protein